MKLGFIGTGIITEAMVTGLLKSDFRASEILISRRGEATSTRLSKMYERVHVCDDNQEIADAADILFLAVRPQIARDVVAPLRFRDHQHVVSLIATVNLETLKDWIGSSAAISRAIPLPSVADLNGVTAIYPRSDIATKIFEALGTAVTAQTVDEFDAYAVASSLMGTYFGVLDAACQWMAGRGATEDRARTYLTGLFHGLANTTHASPTKDFNALRDGHSTAGGLNQQVFEVFSAEGGVRALDRALTCVYERVKN